jgi:hypothetical protein
MISQEPKMGSENIEGILFSRELSETPFVPFVFVVEFFRVGLGRGAWISIFLISGHLISQGGNVLVDLSCHGVFSGGLCERYSSTMLGKMGRLARRTLQATTGDHDRNRAFLDQIVGGGTEENTKG